MRKDNWYRKLGYYNNPFSIKPAAYHDDILGANKILSQLNNKINKGSMAFIEGEFGTGKTSALKKIIYKFMGEKKVIYYSCNRTEKDIDFDELLHSRYGFFGRLLKIKPSEMILLLDEIDEMNKKDCDTLFEYYHQGYFNSIVLVCPDFNRARLTKEHKELVKCNEYILGNIDKSEAVRLVRKRISNLKIISDMMI